LGKEKVVINVYFTNANLLAVGDTTYAYFPLGGLKTVTNVSHLNLLWISTTNDGFTYAQLVRFNLRYRKCFSRTTPYAFFRLGTRKIAAQTAECRNASLNGPRDPSFNGQR